MVTIQVPKAGRPQLVVGGQSGVDLFERVCGACLTTSYIRSGGVWKDLPVHRGYLDSYCVNE